MKIEARPQMLIMIVIVGILMLLSSLCSCQSESGRRSKANTYVSSPTTNQYTAEKVVIIDAAIPKTDDYVTVTWYKVKRIEHGVSDYIRVVGAGLYERGDTIYYKFTR